MRRLLVAFALGLLFVGAVGLALASDQQRKMTGEVVSVDVENKILVVRNEVQGTTEDVRFVVASDAEIRVHGLRSRLDKLDPGDIVTVTYRIEDRKYIATAISHM